MLLNDYSTEEHPETELWLCGFVIEVNDPTRPRVLLGQYTFHDGGQVYSGLLARMPDIASVHGDKDRLTDMIYATSGVKIPPRGWNHLTDRQSGDFQQIAYYYALVRGTMEPKSLGRDALPVSVESVYDLPLNVCSTARWLIPLALDKYTLKPLGITGASFDENN